VTCAVSHIEELHIKICTEELPWMFVPPADDRPGLEKHRLRGRTDVPKIVEWYMQGKIQIDPMITHVMPLNEINNAFDLMKRGESIRGVVTF
jgi:hypothetical protein